MALQLLSTDPAGDGRTVETLVAAAQRALARAAPEAAVRALRRAWAEPQPPERRREVTRILTVAGFRAGDQGALAGVDPLAELRGDRAALVDAAPILAAWLTATGRTDEMVALVDEVAASAR